MLRMYWFAQTVFRMIWMPVFAGVAVEQYGWLWQLSFLRSWGVPLVRQKEMLSLMRMRGEGEEYWAPDLQVLLEDGHEVFRKNAVVAY